MNQPYDQTDRRPPPPGYPPHDYSQPHPSRGYPPPGYPPPGYPPHAYPPSNGLATASMVLGIVALVLTFIPIIGLLAWILAPLALILGFVGMSKPNLPKGQAIAGVITGGLALLMCLLWASALFWVRIR